MKHLLNYLLFVLLAMSFAGCQKDNIVLIDPINTEEDDITNIEFAQTVYVMYSLSEDASVTGTNEDFEVTVSGNDVTIVYSGEEYVMYELSGSTNDGFFKLYSTTKQGITLNGVSITNPIGAAVNVQGTVSEPNKGKRTFIVVNGDNTLYDGETYGNTPSGEDEKATLFSEGQLVFSGEGTLSVSATGKSGIASDDYIVIQSGNINVSMSSNAYYDEEDAEYKSPAGIKTNDYFSMKGGSLIISSSGTGGKGISSDGNGYFSGGNISVTVTGSNYGSSGGWGGNSSNSKSAKGMKFDGNLNFSGSQVYVNCRNHEGIEAKGSLTISDGEVYSTSSADDAINSGGDFTISGGYVCGYSSGNDGLDANGNCYIKGGVVYAISASSPEVAIDANSEGGYKLYLTGGTLVAVGGLESGSSLTQSCYSASSWSQNTWYGLTVGSTTYAFKTPASGGTPLVVSGSSTPNLQSGVSVDSGTMCFEGMFYTNYALINGYGASSESFKNLRHRLLADVTGTIHYGNWNFSLKERFQVTRRTGDFNMYQNPQNALTLKSRLKVQYKGIGRVQPYAYFEVRNYLNAPAIEAAYDGNIYVSLDDYSEEGEPGWFLKGFNGGYVNRLRGSLGADIRLDKRSTLNFYFMCDYLMEKQVDANAEGTKLKSYTKETGFRGWIGAGYEFAF